MAKKAAQKKSTSDIYWILLNGGIVGLSNVIFALFLGAPENAAGIGLLLCYPLFIFAFFVCLGTLGIFVPLTIMRNHQNIKKLLFAHIVIVNSFLFLHLFDLFPPGLNRSQEEIHKTVLFTLLILIPLYLIIKVFWKYFSMHQLVYRLMLIVTAVGYLFFLYFN